MNYLLMIGVAPLSWRLGVVRHKPGVKTVLAFGPFRVALHFLKD